MSATFDLRCGDCLEVMGGMPDGSVDSIVCDPPYGLSKEPDVAEVLRHWLAGDDYAHKGGGFMGKSWDSFVPGPTVWREAYRVLKPGGHLLAFAGSRTQDLMGMSIRLAGFECRDTIMWVYGSGFPKSANVSKMIDKAAGAEREKVPATGGLHKNANMNDDGWSKIGEDNPMMDSTAPATETAKQWDGFGTALKPAYEPCLMFRKPLAKGNTVAANVLEYGCGAINVDGCRVGTESTKRTCNGVGESSSFDMAASGERRINGSDQGRWPANLIHDGSDEVVGLFPVTGAAKKGVRDPNGTMGYHGGASGLPGVVSGHDDNGGSAARFFYCAKSSKRDRNEGCEGLPVKRCSDGRASGLSSGMPEKALAAARNHHPTVKPTDLMRYLCRLVTPPNGTVLDPFMGSGSTGKAAMLEGFNFIGCELDAEYIAIAKARIEWAAQRSVREAEQGALNLY